jgi:hypothetical protein
MGSRLQQEREGGSPNIGPGCKSLGQYEKEWAEQPHVLAAVKERKERGGKSNHGVMVEPGQDLNEIPKKHQKRRSYT